MIVNCESLINNFSFKSCQNSIPDVMLMVGYEFNGLGDMLASCECS